MPIVLLVLLSKPLTCIKTNNFSPLRPSRTRCRIILIIPGLVAIASKHCHLTAQYYGYIYNLNYDVIIQSQGMTILYFIFRMNMRYIYYLVQMLFSPPGTVMLAVLTSYFIGDFSQLCIGSGPSEGITCLIKPHPAPFEDLLKEEGLIRVQTRSGAIIAAYFNPDRSAVDKVDSLNKSINATKETEKHISWRL